MDFKDEYLNVKHKIEKELHLSDSFDVGNREFTVDNRKFSMFYVTGLVDSLLISEIYKNVTNTKNDKNISGTFEEKIRNAINHQQVEYVDKINNFGNSVLAGMVGLIFEEMNQGIIIDLRSYPGRGPSEPDTERVVRGSRDGYTENIIINTALTRRRIRVGNLINELYKVGSQSKTDVVISYIKGVADEDVVNEIRNRVKSIDINELTMSDKALEEIITRQGISPYPKVRFTERPDTVAVHLYQGQVAIFIDTSPSVILAPVTFFDHLQHVEEFRQTPLVGSFLRILRYMGIFVSLFLVPIWFLIASSSNMPDFLSAIGPKEMNDIPLFYQFLLAEIGIEFLRMAAIHTPNPISTAMGIIAGIIIGDMAIAVGYFVPEVVLYTAVSQIGSYATPSYELALANKISKIFFLVATFIFGWVGLVTSITLWLLLLASTKSFGKSYMTPVIPFKLKGFIKLFVRFPFKSK